MPFRDWPGATGSLPRPEQDLIHWTLRDPDEPETEHAQAWYASQRQWRFARRLGFLDSQFIPGR